MLGRKWQDVLQQEMKVGSDLLQLPTHTEKLTVFSEIRVGNFSTEEEPKHSCAKFEGKAEFELQPLDFLGCFRPKSTYVPGLFKLCMRRGLNFYSLSAAGLYTASSWHKTKKICFFESHQFLPNRVPPNGFPIANKQLLYPFSVLSAVSLFTQKQAPTAEGEQERDQDFSRSHLSSLTYKDLWTAEANIFSSSYQVRCGPGKEGSIPSKPLQRLQDPQQNLLQF